MSETKTVPVEPTQGMIRAAENITLPTDPPTETELLRQVYKAMLAAAPSQPPTNLTENSSELVDAIVLPNTLKHLIEWLDCEPSDQCATVSWLRTIAADWQASLTAPSQPQLYLPRITPDDVELFKDTSLMTLDHQWSQDAVDFACRLNQTPAPSQPAEPDELARLEHSYAITCATEELMSESIIDGDWMRIAGDVDIQVFNILYGNNLLKDHPTEPGLVRVRNED